MAIERTQYLTVAELNEILGVLNYTDDNLIDIYEASELLKYHMNDDLVSYDTSSAPTNLKLATAYQVLFNESGIDDDYAGSSGSYTIGKFSNSNASTSEVGEYNKISPKSRRYLIDGKLTRRIV
jgi:hypothetical protein